jgi:hypothetical protein
MRRTSILHVVVLLSTTKIAAAQERRQPVQELFLTETVYPQEKHELQLTLGSLVDRSRADRAGLVPFSIEFGLTDRWQVQAGWDGYTRFQGTAPFTHLRSARASVGTKYSFMNIARSPVHAAVGVDVEFPRPNALAEGEGEQDMEFEPFLAAAFDLGRHVTIFGSVAASLEPGQVGDLVLHKQPPDDRGTIAYGVLLGFHRETFALEYTTRSDVLPWRLDGAPLVTPSFIVRLPTKWELAIGAPFSGRAGHRRPGIAMHLVKEF